MSDKQTANSRSRNIHTCMKMFLQGYLKVQRPPRRAKRIRGESCRQSATRLRTLECNGHQEEAKLLLGERRCERRKRCNGHREEQSEFEVKVAGSLRQD